MNWFSLLLKRSQLEKDWWRNALYHISNAMPHIFPSGEEPSIVDKKLFTSISENSVGVRFLLFANSNQYNCMVRFYFDRPVNQQSIESIQMTGCDCFALRTSQDGTSRALSEQLIPQESTPYNILMTIKELIVNDTDEEDNDDSFDYTEQPNIPPGIGADSPIINR